MPKFLNLLLATSVLAATLPAWGADDMAGAGGAPAAGAEEFDLEDVFGFTEGTDVKAAGDVSVDFGAEGRLGKGEGRYGAVPVEAKASYGATDRIELGFSLLAAGYAIENVPSIEDRSRFVFDGVAGEVKLAVVDRGEEGPIGLSLVGDVGWNRTDGTSGVFSDAFSGGVVVLADTHLVPDTVFAAVNVGVDAERDVDADETTSTLFASFAASYRLAEATTVGFDARVESAFDGVLDERTGTATFLGPTFYMALTDSLSLQAAWLAQVDGSGGRFDTEDFERHRVTATIEVGF